MWQIGMRPREFVEEWLKVPQKIIGSTKAKISDPYSTRLIELRWGGFQLHRNDLGTKIIYSKALWAENNLFDWLEFATPRLYFLTGDGSRFSPANVEPIPSILFPFWLAGLLFLIREKRFKPIIALGIGAGLGYIAGVKNMAILLPTLLIQIYIVMVGLSLLKDKKWFGLLVGIIAIYCIYTVDMTLYAR